MKIDKPGCFDIPADEYHADPCPTPSLSSGTIKALLHRSPRHVWTGNVRLNPDAETVHKEAFDIGTAAHTLMLGTGEDIAVIDADSWRTKDAKAERDAAYAAGKTPLLAHQYADVKAMVFAGRAQLDAHHDASGAFLDGIGEQSLFWKEGPVWARARLDWMPTVSTVFPDYKTTSASANPDSWARTGFDIGSDIQAAWSLRGIRAVMQIEDPRFVFVVQETYAPYLLSVVTLSPSALGMAERKIDEALATWEWCLKNDKWPGYPAHTCTIDAPGWQEKAWLEREERAQFHKEAGEDMREMMNDWQAPL